MVIKAIKMPFEFTPLGIPGVILIKPQLFEDERGFFMETYKKADFNKVGISSEFVQDNHSRSSYGVLRGLHFQKKPYVQEKIVRCVRGVIYDVAVDLREASPTFSKYVGVYLSEENGYQLYVPRHFAHGYLVLSEVADVLYKVDNLYAPAHEAGLIWKDPDVNVLWPNKNPILSPKDQQLPSLKELIERNFLF